MHRAIRGEYAAGGDRRRSVAGPAGDTAARLGDHQDAGCDVPGGDADLEVAVVAAAGDVGEVEGGGAGAADVVGAEHDVGNEPEVRLRVALPRFEGKAGGEERRRAGRHGTHPDGAAVEPDAAAARRLEDLSQEGGVDDAHGGACVVEEGDADTGEGVAVHVVRRPVHGVDDPAPAGDPNAAGELLRDDGVTREVAADARGDGALR